MLGSEAMTYFSLIACTAGTLAYLFLIILLLGHRRPRRLEYLLFLTCLAAFLSEAGSLLALNARLHFGDVPPLSAATVQTLSGLALVTMPVLLFHLHAEYFHLIQSSRWPAWLCILTLPPYVSAILRIFLVAERVTGSHLLADVAGGLLDVGHSTAQPVVETGIVVIGTAGTVLVPAILQLSFWRRAGERHSRTLHFILGAYFTAVLLAVGVLGLWFLEIGSLPPSVLLPIVENSAPVLPGALLLYFILRHKFLQIGIQRNLVYTVSGAFLALAYLTLARRASVWLEPYFPPEATVGILLFALVFFFEPLQRMLRSVLQHAFRVELERVQRLTAEIGAEARGGDLPKLVGFTERRIGEEFDLTGVRLVLSQGPPRLAVAVGKMDRFVLRKGREALGTLEVFFPGAMLPGETHAALEFLAEQLPAPLELCGAIEEKLALERELAERERMALLGQMAATISHNLKNPLSSIKTVMQVQLENAALPETLRRDCAIVVEEIDRLAGKLQQLLQYARPAVRRGSGIHAARVDSAAVAARVVELLQNDAVRRGIALRIDAAPGPMPVAGPEDALHDVLQNLVVNALEAAEPGGSVGVALAVAEARAHIVVTDDGPGISPERLQKIFRPFYTSKPQGTGLGLAIVERRLGELEGSVECVSPVENGRGARFVVKIPIVAGT